jgi:hypothetical protein
MRKAYNLSLNGCEFTVFENEYFDGEEGAFYAPVPYVYQTAYNDKNGKAKPTSKVGVNWVKHVEPAA